jgi:hypothetical protein
MMHSLKSLGVVTVGVGLMVSACASAPGQESSASTDSDLALDQALDMESSDRVHTMPWKGVEQDSTVQASAAPAGAHLTYYGGPVIPKINIIAVYWGAGAAHQAHLNSFYGSIVQSTYFDWLKEYNTSTQSIGRGTFQGAHVITPSTTATKITDKTIQREITKQITAGHLPKADGVNNLYMVHFPPGMHITGPGGAGASCVQFCAYHGTFKQSGKYVFYGVVPDLDHDGCQNGCGAGTPENNVTEVSSHEMIEAVTDPAVGLATTNGPPLAWYDSANGEIGDICNGSAATVGAYTVQLEWSNKQNACVSH